MVSEATHVLTVTADNKGLNPCSCGGWSQRVVMLDTGYVSWQCLNPCSCGGWSQSVDFGAAELTAIRLNPCSCGGWSQSIYGILMAAILIGS